MQPTCQEQSELLFFPESMVSMMSFVSLSRAVSVEWNLRYAGLSTSSKYPTLA